MVINEINKNENTSFSLENGSRNTFNTFREKKKTNTQNPPTHPKAYQVNIFLDL